MNGPATRGLGAGEERIVRLKVHKTAKLPKDLYSIRRWTQTPGADVTEQTLSISFT